MTKREDWIDACKGIGIICVVAGHVLMQTELSREIARVIFLFHMPLFFMISGYTFKPEARSSFVRKRMYALLLPYLSFMLLLDALTLLRTTAIEGMPSLAVLASLLARNILGGRYLGSDFGVFWFVTCLFIALLVFNEIELRYQATPRRALLAVTACFAASIPVAAFPAVNAAPWSLANVPLAICFLWAGKTARRTDRRLLASAAAGVITIAAAASYGGLEFVFDMKKVLYGPPILGVLLAASLSVIIMLAMQLLKEQNRLIQPLKALGSASLVIMFLHQLIHYTLLEFGYHSEPLLIAAALIIPFVAHKGISSSKTLSYVFLGKRQSGLAPRPAEAGSVAKIDADALELKGSSQTS